MENSFGGPVAIFSYSFISVSYYEREPKASLRVAKALHVVAFKTNLPQEKINKSGFEFESEHV